jgi:hypothetical protein
VEQANKTKHGQHTKPDQHNRPKDRPYSGGASLLKKKQQD